MELKDFIKGSLLEIMSAVSEAQREWRADPNNKGTINPAWGDTRNLDKATQNVEFDVAVTVSSGASGRAGAGIKVFSVDVGASGEKKSESSSVSRLRFQVPIVPPVEVVERPHRRAVEVDDGG